MNFGSPEELLAYKKYIISLLVQHAMADNEFSFMEGQFLEYAGLQLQLSEEEIKEVQKNPSLYEIAPPPDEQKRVTILYYALFMMRADGKIKPEEEDTCYKLGLRLGFRSEMLDNLIQLMKEYLLKELPPTAMVDEIRPYLN